MIIRDRNGKGRVGWDLFFPFISVTYSLPSFLSFLLRCNEHVFFFVINIILSVLFKSSGIQ